MTRPALRFPAPDWNVDREPRTREVPWTAISISLACVTVLLVGAFLSGMAYSERGDLHKIAGMVIRGLAIDSLVDSSRVTLQRWARMPHNRATRPLGARKVLDSPRVGLVPPQP